MNVHDQMCNVVMKYVPMGPVHSGQVEFSQGNELSHDVSAGVIVSNRSLVLQRVRRNQSGTFTCHAENAEDAASSNEVELRVKCE